MSDSNRQRRNMVDNQLKPNRIEDPRVLDAMGEVPREIFLPKSLRGVAYNDEDIDLGQGRHLIEPLAFAKLLQAAAIEPSDVVLILGDDTGYCAAVLARLAGTVFLLCPAAHDAETIDSQLSSLASDNTVVQSGDLRVGLDDQAPFDVIVLAGSVPEVPQVFLDQLGPRGRLVTVLQDGRAGYVALYEKVDEAVGMTSPFDAYIPPLVALLPEPGFSF